MAPVTNSRLRVYFGHHKCMTTWVRHVLQRVCNELSWNYVEMNISGSEYIRRNKVDMLSYQDPDMEIVRTLEDFVGFHIIRDPPDIVVSAYFSHLHSHATDNWPELSAYRAELQKLSKDDGLLLEMEFLRREFKQLYEWDYAQENVLELKMEDVVANPYDQIVRALLFYRGGCREHTAQDQVAGRGCEWHSRFGLSVPDSVHSCAEVCAAENSSRIFARLYLRDPLFRNDEGAWSRNGRRL